jgi:hypothetical protein
LHTNVTENSRDKQERTIATFGTEETERKRKSQNKNKNEQHRHNQTPMMMPCIYKSNSSLCKSPDLSHRDISVI